MLVLFETPAGYAIFKLLDEKKLRETDNLYKSFETPEAAGQIVKLKHFEKFADTSEALAATTAAVEGKLSKHLKKVLKKYIDKDLQEKLLVADAKLGSAIREKLSVQCLSNTAVQELMRCIRSQLDSLISGLPKKEMTAMALGLAHSLSRYKLKFSPDKVDTMIIQAVNLLDDLDKELNNYNMRCREWYGWHFPELGKIVTDNMAYAKTVKIIGTRDNTATSDLSDILPEEIEERVKEAAEVSMGTEISMLDILNMQNLCDQIIDITNYRIHLYDYLKARMMAMAPNLTVLVGDLVGARLISHAGSLINLAKHPASTVQILGAEKALFRALKSKKDTPKYGLIYHSQLVGQSSTKNKGKMSRMLAAKASLATRVDALGEDGNFTLGPEHRTKLELRLRILEEGNIRRISGTGKAKAKFEKYHGVSEVKQYPEAADSTLPSTSKRKRSESGLPKEDIETAKQKKKRLKRELKEEEPSEVQIEESEHTPKKKKKYKRQQPDDEVIEGETEIPTFSKKTKKKKVKQELEESEAKVAIMEESEVPSSEKKKKKKKVKQELEESEAKVEIMEESEVPSSEKKKKKKKIKQELEESEAKVEIMEESEVPSSEKKKKKKKVKQELEESIAKIEIFEELEVPSSEKKKKKKKVKQELEESEAKVEIMEQFEIPRTQKKKKKVKQELEELQAKVEVTEEAGPSSGKKKKKKEKVKQEFKAPSISTKEVSEGPSSEKKKKKKKKLSM